MNTTRTPTTVLQQYDSLAGFRGWLPIGISRDPKLTRRDVLDAARRCEWTDLDLSRELTDYANHMEA